MAPMRRRWFSRRAVGLHLVLLIWFPGCITAGWWQADVAMSGNTLSYLYAVEWPAFAIFGAVVWWNLIHDEPTVPGGRSARLARRQAVSGPGPSLADDLDEEARALVAAEDPEMAAYNAYLATLAEEAPKTWRSG